MEAPIGLRDHPPFVQKKKKSLKFTYINDAVEVDIDLIRKSEGERSSRVVKMKNGDYLKFTVRLLFDFYFYFHYLIFG